MTCRRILLAALILFVAAAPAWAEKRVALVIGNDRYFNLQAGEQLHNAVNDARVLRDTLQALGFEVLAGENLTRAEMLDRMADFTSRVRPGDIAFLFYAGHGIALNGQNYLLPSDIPAPRTTGPGEEERIGESAVSETRIDDWITGSKARVAVVVLDACRNDPLATPIGRSLTVGRGLARPQETEGLLTIYSAGVGQEALDRLRDDDSDPNSVFTRVFIKELARPGAGLREAAFATQGKVASLARSVDRDQVPGVYSQIIGEDVRLSSTPPAPKRDFEAELMAALNSGNPAEIDAALVGAPSGPLADIARRERDRLRSDAAAKQQGPTPVPAPASSPVLPAGGDALKKDEAPPRPQMASLPDPSDILRLCSSSPASCHNASPLNASDIIARLKQELRRVGCEPDTGAGWTRRDHAALERFWRGADPDGEILMPSKIVPDQASLTAVSARGEGACPVCGVGHHLDALGNCLGNVPVAIHPHPRPAPVRQAAAVVPSIRKPRPASGKCHVFDGETYC